MRRRKTGSLPLGRSCASTSNVPTHGDPPRTAPTRGPPSRASPDVSRGSDALGLRNPWRCGRDPDTGAAICGDVGQVLFCLDCTMPDYRSVPARHCTVDVLYYTASRCTARDAGTVPFFRGGLMSPDVPAISIFSCFVTLFYGWYCCVTIMQGMWEEVDVLTSGGIMGG